MQNNHNLCMHVVRVLSTIWGGGGGGGLSITVNECRARYARRFDACIVCKQQGDWWGVIVKYSRGQVHVCICGIL